MSGAAGGGDRATAGPGGGTRDEPAPERVAGSGTRVALLVGRLSGGGYCRVAAALAGAFARAGYRAEIVTFKTPDIPPTPLAEGVTVVRLGAPAAGESERGLLRWAGRHPGVSWSLLLRQALISRLPFARPYAGASRLWLLRSVRESARYLADFRPTVLYPVGETANLLAVAARTLSDAPTRVIAGLHAAAPRRRAAAGDTGWWRARLLARGNRRALHRADGIIAVSRGLADEWAEEAAIPRSRIAVVHNPVVGRGLSALAASPLHYPWFREGGPPLILGAGRLEPQKDFETLLRAFAAVRRRRPARLAILGDGPLLPAIRGLADRLGVRREVLFPGFVSNPFAWMARAGVFALSSKWEGFGMVLVEALACGCPVVSTDCPSGPAEILDGGAYGRLVPVGDPQAMAEAILETLDRPPERDLLRRRGARFSEDRALPGYARFVPPAPLRFNGSDSRR